MEDENQPIAPQPVTSSETGQGTTASPKYNMENMMGNFLDMPQKRRELATRLIATPAVELFDEIIGEPAIASLREQLGNTIEVGGEDTAPAPEGMMAPSDTPATTPVAESAPAESDEDKGDDSTMMI